MIKTKAYVNKEAYREAVKAFPDDCAESSDIVHALRMGYQVCYIKHKPINEIDMKSIEERAKTSYLRSNVQGTTIASSHEVGYIQGATEQESIDKEEWKKKIDDICEWAYNFKLPNGVAPLYDYVGNIRRKLEE